MAVKSATVEQVLDIQVGETLKTERHTLVADWNSRHNEINVLISDENGHLIGYFAPKTYVNIYMQGL